MVVWEKYVKKYVWDDDKTPYFIPVSNLKRDQADKEMFLYCIFLAIPAALIVAAFVGALGDGDFSNLSLGMYGAAILISAGFMKFRKSTVAALFAISAPVVLLLHLAINGFTPPDISTNRAQIAAADIGENTLTLDAKKRWQTGQSMVLSSVGILPEPLVSGETYYLIQKNRTVYQLAATLENAHSGAALNLSTAGEGPNIIRRVIQLHFVEQAMMILLVLAWLRYTLRAVAITKVYETLPVRDMNPWSKLPPGGTPPRK